MIQKNASIYWKFSGRKNLPYSGHAVVLIECCYMSKASSSVEYEHHHCQRFDFQLLLRKIFFNSVNLPFLNAN